jgi:LCP family protein required for cell wall assembly
MSGPAANTGTSANEGATERMRWRGFWGRLVIAVVIASACTTSAVALVDRGITDRVADIQRVVIPQLAPAPPGGANYLIIGSDTRAFVDNPDAAAAFGDPNNPEEGVEGQRSDTLMVAHVEPSAQRTFVVSFPRDLMVNVPGTPGLSMINSAYSTGGPELVRDTLKANFDIDINHYLEVDFQSFKEIVNEIGNVRVYLPGRVRDLELGMLSPYGAGCYDVDGDTALVYVRSRFLQISDPDGDYVDPDTGEHWRSLDIRADLDRIDRQQQFIRKLTGLAISRSLGDPFLAVSLADNVLGYVKADQTLSRDDVNALVRAFRTVDVYDNNALRFETLPVEQWPENRNRLIASPDADAVVQQLRTFGDDTPKPATVLPSQVKVRVVDATGTNVGASVVKALADQGFQTTQARTRATIPVTEIRYGYGQSEEALALLPYFADAKLVPDPTAKDSVSVALGTSFGGTIFVPPTTTTVPGTPVTSAPPSPTTTIGPAPSDPCSQ